MTYRLIHPKGYFSQTCLDFFLKHVFLQRTVHILFLLFVIRCIFVKKSIYLAFPFTYIYKKCMYKEKENIIFAKY